jgi:hypothetical protein
MIFLAACGAMAVEPGVVVLPTMAATASSATIEPTATATATVTATVEAEVTPESTAAVITTTAAETTSIAVFNTNVQFIMALNDVNIRSGPGTSYSIIGWVADGQMAKVTGISSDGNWWRVICPDNTVGNCWVTAGSQYTQPTTGPGNQPAPTAAANTCFDAATFVADVTVPDKRQFTQYTVFVKTWRVKYIGTCTWTCQ